MEKDKPAVYQQTDPNIIQRISGGLNSLFGNSAPTVAKAAPVSPTPAPTKVPTSFAEVGRTVGAPVATPSPLPAPSVDANIMRNMISVYGGADAPLHKYADQLAGATRYDFWKNNPELLALIPHLETSSGRHVSRPNNLTNWGINYPGNNAAFAEMTPAEVLQRWIAGMAEKSPYYQPFRTGKPLTDEEIMALAKIYEPANASYGPNLINGRKFIREQLGF